jgi:hypothetical protein
MNLNGSMSRVSAMGVSSNLFLCFGGRLLKAELSWRKKISRAQISRRCEQAFWQRYFPAKR